MFRTVEKYARSSINEASQKLYGTIIKEIPLEKPPNPNLGDISSSVGFKLAKKLKKSPIEISRELKNAIIKPSIFEKIEVVGPYLNFYIDQNQFAQKVLKSVDEDYGKLKTKNKKIILEHTSANPNGPLHIGHIRNAIIGDSLARIMRSAGYFLETQYYVNDMGRQIAMIVWGLKNLKFNISPEQKPDVEIGKLYFLVNQELKSNPKIKKEIDSILKKYEEENPKELEKYFKEVVNTCLKGIKATNHRLKIKHDRFVWESSFVRDSSVSEVLKNLNDYLIKNDVLYLDLKDYGIDKELILLRSDGTSLYTTRDLAYHRQKSSQADQVIDVLGSDHKLAVEQLKIALKLLRVKTPDVIFYEFITLPEGSMSTRKGVFISVDELMDEAVARALEEIKLRRPDLDEDDAKKAAEMIGIGAIRYYIARLSPEKHIVFKWDEALNFEQGCASIQYAHARAVKLLEKSDYTKEELGSDINLDKKIEPLEIELIKSISQFPSIIDRSASSLRVYPVAQYVLELSRAFNKFYKSVPVIGSDNELFRILLVDKTRITIKNALELLGIEAPRYM